MCLSVIDGARVCGRFVELESFSCGAREFVRIWKKNKFVEVQILLESKKLKNRKREVPISKEPF